MPVVFLERIPLPSLRTYTTISVVLLSCAVYYAYQTVTAFEEITSVGRAVPVEHGQTSYESVPDAVHVLDAKETETVESMEDMTNYTLPYDSLFWNLIHIMSSEGWCIWTLVNTAYCCLILLGKCIQRQVFGELRVSEQQHLKDKVWNFLFYKFIFIFGVMNVQTMEEVVSWVAWFTILGFFHLLIQLSKDRFEYVSFSPATSSLFHVKLMSLLSLILLCSFGLLIMCGFVGLQAGITILAFMAAECLILGIRVLYVVVRYIIHLMDMNMVGVWENRTIYVYYAELIFELAVLSVDFAHHLHMLLWGNIFLSMASLVICMQLRYLFYEIQRRIKRHKNYRRVVQNMEARFSMANKEELESNNDNCAICWEAMESARKLPCSHLFHNACLRSWLEQDTSCPTCRKTLNERQEEPVNQNMPDERGDAANNIPAPPAGNRAFTNHFFHFDGSRYVSWFPSFSVEVTHTQLLPGGQPVPVQTSQLDSMARQVESVFPHIPLNAIMDDLRQTRSVDFTIENILEGRLQVPPPGTLVGRAALGEPDQSTENTESPSQMIQPAVISASGTNSVSSSQREENIPDRTNNLIDENLPSLDLRRGEAPTPFGGRFSKSASERETMLQDRKNAMLEQARRRYLSKSPGQETESISSSLEFTQEHISESSEGENGDRVRRRELAFEAAQRRMYHRE